jgi:hypothetical protein
MSCQELREKQPDPAWGTCFTAAIMTALSEQAPLAACRQHTEPNAAQGHHSLNHNIMKMHEIGEP